MSTITCGSGARAGILYWQRKTEGDCLKSWLSVAGGYIMETFPIVKRKDKAKYGDYRTKRLILDIYDRMQEAIATGRPYETILSPPPADPRASHKPERHAAWCVERVPLKMLVFRAETKAPHHG